MVDEEQAFAVQDVAVVVVIQLHGGAPVVADVLDGLRAWDRVRALLEHVGKVVGVQLGVDLRVEAVNQLDTVGSADTVRSCCEQECQVPAK